MTPIRPRFLPIIRKRKKQGVPSNAGLSEKPNTSKDFRLLKPNELVSRGDFVAELPGEFQPWEGPTGFRADSFVKPIYRKLVVRLAEAEK